jgi:hypothetical protein
MPAIGSRVLVALAAALALVAALTWTALRPTDFSAADAAAAYERLRARLDPLNPGRGIADYPGQPVADIPKGYAMVVLAELQRRKSRGDHPLDLARVAGNWLLDHSDENRNGLVGWGVPVAWDAYGDGSVNPADTEYTISTAIAVAALLNWLEIDPSAPKDRIMRVVEAALRPYVDPEVRSPSGLSPYSLVRSDWLYDTFNPAVYLAGQMQRFSRFVDEPLASTLRSRADENMRILLAHQQTDPDGNWYWNYSVQERVPNDLAHASYIIDGILTYVENGGALGSRFDSRRTVGHLASFLRGDDLFVSAWPTFRSDVQYPARSYDIGAGLALATRFPTLLPNSVAARMANHLPAYARPDGWYRKYPAAGDKKSGDDLVVGEYQAYMLYGLAAWAATADQ